MALWNFNRAAAGATTRVRGTAADDAMRFASGVRLRSACSTASRMRAK